MPSESELNQRIVGAYHAVMRDGTVAALGREAIKDVRSTFMEVFFGKGERGSEPGTPLNPLYYDLVQARNSHAGPHGQPMQKGASMSSGESLPTPSEIIANPQAYLPETGNSNDNAMAMSAAEDLSHGNSGSLPTPSEIIANPQAYLPEQEHGHEHQHGHGHGH
jgi:hypothetical protein